MRCGKALVSTVAKIVKVNYHLAVNDIALEIASDETVLQALQRQGYRLRYSCRNGVCELCQFRLCSGQLTQSYPVKVLSEAGEIGLCCTARADSDVSIEIDGLKIPGELTVKKVNCSILSVNKLNHDVYQVKLQLPATASQSVEYIAGQYLDIVIPGFHNASFSIASAPEAGRELELHIRHNPQSDISNAIIEHLNSQKLIDIELPKGAACLKASDLGADTKLILAAASTGFSQVKSIVEHLLASKVKNEIHIYWGVRVASDLYWSLLAESWAQEHSQIVFHPVISDPTAECEWTGRTDLLPAAILQDFSDFSDVIMMASGSPAMVYALLDGCESKGFKESQLLSDVLAYAPRPQK